jgi:hypothetical protein
LFDRAETLGRLAVQAPCRRQVGELLVLNDLIGRTRIWPPIQLIAVTIPSAICSGLGRLAEFSTVCIRSAGRTKESRHLVADGEMGWDG